MRPGMSHMNRRRINTSIRGRAVASVLQRFLSVTSYTRLPATQAWGRQYRVKNTETRAMSLLVLAPGLTRLATSPDRKKMKAEARVTEVGITRNRSSVSSVC